MQKILISTAMAVTLAGASAAVAAPANVATLVSTTTQRSAFVSPSANVSTFPLVADRGIEAGTVTIFAKGNQLVVTYETSGGWTLGETHLEIALNAKDFPQTRNSQPRPNQFAYGEVQGNGVTAVQYVFELGSSTPSQGRVYVAANAEVTARRAREGAWSGGTRFTGSDPATYSTFVRQGVDCVQTPNHKDCPS